MTHPLDGPRLKTARAREQLDAFRDEQLAYFRREPYYTVSKFEPERGEYVIRYRVIEPPPPRLSVLIGDVVHNLSSTLEHLAWQLVIASGNDPIERVTGFPIFESQPNYAKLAPAMVQGIKPEFVTEIERLQPYNREPPESDPLAVLRYLWNRDKHRLLVTTNAFVKDAVFGVRALRDIDLGMALTLSPHVIEDGAEFAAIPATVTGPDPQVDVKGHGRVDVAFAEGSVTGLSVVDVLSGVVTGVRDARLRLGGLAFPGHEPAPRAEA